MATANQKRIVAWNLWEKANIFVEEVLPAVFSINAWTLTGSEQDLPSEAEVKRVLLIFEAIQKPANSISDDLAAIRSA